MPLIEIVPDRCEGHGRCFVACPDIFVPDDEGFVTVPNPEVEEDRVAEVQRAVVGCPERALRLT